MIQIHYSRRANKCQHEKKPGGSIFPAGTFEVFLTKELPSGFYSSDQGLPRQSPSRCRVSPFRNVQRENANRAPAFCFPFKTKTAIPQYNSAKAAARSDDGFCAVCTFLALRERFPGKRPISTPRPARASLRRPSGSPRCSRRRPGCPRSRNPWRPARRFCRCWS